MNKWVLAGVVAASISVLVGCSSSPKTVQVEIKNMAFSTKQIDLQAGVPVKLVLVNHDKEVHDLSVETIPVDITAQTADPEGHVHTDGKEPDLHVAVKPGDKGWVEFTPTAAGTYSFYCSVPGHKASGMEGTLVVK